MSVNEMKNKNNEIEYENSGIEDHEQPVVPEEEPDLAGRWVLRGKNLVVFFLRPLWKGLSLFLAPLWKPFRKGADKVTRRDWALFLGMILAAVLIVGAPVVWIKLRNTHREKEELYCVLLGEKMYWQGAKFEIDEDNRVHFFDGQGNETDVSGWPFYYVDQDVMFWPFYGFWYAVEDTKCARVECFSQIKYEYGTGCSIQLPDGEERVLPGFLYDNQDTYVFLESVSLSYDNEMRSLAPLSYVRVYGNNFMELYYYGEEQGETIILESDPIAQFSNGARIDLKGDTMKYPNGRTRLLFGGLEYFNPLGSE